MGGKETFFQMRTKLNSVRDWNEKFPQKLHFGEEAFPMGLLLYKRLGKKLFQLVKCFL